MSRTAAYDKIKTTNWVDGNDTQVKQLKFLLLGAYVFLYVGSAILIMLGHTGFTSVSLSVIIVPFLIGMVTLLISIKQTNAKKVMASIVLIPPVICLFLLSINQYNSIFTTNKWVKNKDKRVYLVDHLLEKYELEGMAKDDVNALLGNPTTTEYFKEDENYVYYLGPERGPIRIDSEWLVISFNEKDIVERYEVKTD